MTMHVVLQRLWIQLTADRKRFGVLCGALCVALLLWARVIVVSNVPRSAIADEEAAAKAAAAALLTSYPDIKRDRDETSASGRRPVVLDRSPNRDPFVISTRYFPRGSGDDGSKAEVDKSALQPAEDSEQARIRQLAVLREVVERFRLDAVMNVGEGTGSAMALINGRTWRQGQQIPAVGNEELLFELVQVRHRSAVLRLDEHLFELKMDH